VILTQNLASLYHLELPNLGLYGVSKGFPKAFMNGKQLLLQRVLLLADQESL